MAITNVLYLLEYRKYDRNLKAARSSRPDPATLQCGTIEIGTPLGTVLNTSRLQYPQVCAIDIAGRSIKYNIVDKEDCLCSASAYLVHTVSLGIA